MESITAGTTRTSTPDASGYIDVVALGDGTLAGVSRAPNLKSNVSISKLASVRYGPYGVPMDFTIACTNGTITYTTTAGYGADSGNAVIGTGNQAAMLAVSGATVGVLFTRTDTTPYTTWQLDALPATSLANWREVGATEAPAVRVPFSGAGTDVLVWVGEGVLLQCVLTASATGSIVVKDQITAGTGPTVTTLTTTAVPETFLLNSGAGSTIYGGITLTITGANTGYLLVKGV